MLYFKNKITMAYIFPGLKYRQCNEEGDLACLLLTTVAVSIIQIVDEDYLKKYAPSLSLCLPDHVNNIFEWRRPETQFN